jgi:hypothetical protein
VFGDGSFLLGNKVVKFFKLSVEIIQLSEVILDCGLRKFNILADGSKTFRIWVRNNVVRD